VEVGRELPWKGERDSGKVARLGAVVDFGGGALRIGVLEIAVTSGKGLLSGSAQGLSAAVGPGILRRALFQLPARSAHVMALVQMRYNVGRARQRGGGWTVGCAPHRLALGLRTTSLVNARCTLFLRPQSLSRERSSWLKRVRRGRYLSSFVLCQSLLPMPFYRPPNVAPEGHSLAQSNTAKRRASHQPSCSCVLRTVCLAPMPCPSIHP